MFTRTPFDGAQLAVIPEAEGLDDRQMQLIARELNLAESVFLTGSRSLDACRLRIFSPSNEREFSGHASIAAGFVLARFGYLKITDTHETITLQQHVGEIELVVSGHQRGELFIQFNRVAEAVTDRFVPANKQLADMLSLKEQDIANSRYNTLLVSCDLPYLVIPLRSFSAVRAATFNYSQWSTAVAPVSPTNEILLFATKSDIPEANFQARLLGPQIGVDEDPPIASAMPAFAGYLSAHEHVKQGTHSFTIDRGTTRTRKSILSIGLVRQAGKENRIRVGGPAVIDGEGSLIAP